MTLIIIVLIVAFLMVLPALAKWLQKHWNTG
jgi:hypothetical protein